MKVDIKTQLSIVVPNQPGQIALILKSLAGHQVNIGSIMFVDTTGQGVVRFVIEDAQAAQKTLEEAGFYVVAAQVAVVQVPNRVGALYQIAQALGDAGINIDYAYGSDSPGHIHDTFMLSDLPRGVEIIRAL